ncbi:MAG: hypothetical protein DMG12_10310 [Acidobacteria bacterium]|nr:MAG: hypothetical protein DMG12_10310 [Acidobacteriota bacterium]
METGLKAFSILGFILTSGFTGVGQIVAAGAPEGSLVLTIHVSNGAEVDPVTLIQAERTATGIFKKAGVESRWVDPGLRSEGKLAHSLDEGSFPRSHIQLTILPGLISNRLGAHNLPDDVMGLAPGSGPERQWVYAFYDRVEAFAVKHITDTHADAAQILGHVIAHEIGHLLLNDQTHSATGIMRGPWNLWDVQNASYGHLLFTTRQAEAIKAEVSRRLRK